jgi:hypothetical protein
VQGAADGDLGKAELVQGLLRRDPRIDGLIRRFSIALLAARADLFEEDEPLQIFA